MKRISEFKKNITMYISRFLVAMLLFNPDMTAQPGSLDLSFNGNGKHIFGINGTSRSVAIQTDGKIVLGGNAWNSSSEFAFLRCNTNGSLDNTFGVNGIARVDIGPNSDIGRALAIQSDGKIILAGQTNNGANDDIALVRINANGTIDNTFGVGGIVTTTVSSYDESAYSIAIQLDGKIVVGCHAYGSSSYDFMLVRYNTNGSLDNAFGNNGIVLTDIGLSTTDQIYSIAIQTDGRIIAAGINSASTYDFCLVRYNANGTIDNTFGAAGKVITDISVSDELKSITIQTDGKIVAAGSTIVSSYRDFTLVRYNVNGTLDNSFGNLGVVTSSIGITNDMVYSVNLQQDGKIVAVGYIEVGMDTDAALIRYNSNGTLDNSFGVGGKVISPISTTSYDFIENGIIDNNGKILIVGNVDNQIGVARFISECNLDTSIVQNGVILSSNQTGAHQWLDCSNSMAQLSNETNQTYTPTVNGSYAVQISNNGCVDTSACISITNVGIIEIERDSNFKISPNPNNGEFTMTTIKGSYSLINSIGEIVRVIEVRNDNEYIDIKDLSQGVYYIIGKTAKAKIIITK